MARTHRPYDEEFKRRAVELYLYSNNGLKQVLSGRGSGTGKLHSGNLYQLLAYLRNREATKPDGPRHEGILLYPEVSGPPTSNSRGPASRLGRKEQRS